MLRSIIALALAALIVAALPLRGEETPAIATKSAAPASESAPAHPTSATTLHHISAALPKFDPKQGATDAAPAVPAAEPAPRSVFVLPKYVVRERQPIPENDVMTAKAQEDAIVKRYVGTPSDLDVALNKFTFNTLWKKIPILGSHSDFASMTYKQRIAEDYKKIEAQRKLQEALGVSANVPPTKTKTDNARSDGEKKPPASPE